MADTAITSQAAAPERRAFKDKITGFFADVNKEMKKVTWPTREQLIEATLVTIVMVLVASIFVFGIDKVFEIMLRLIYGF